MLVTDMGTRRIAGRPETRPFESVFIRGHSLFILI